MNFQDLKKVEDSDFYFGVGVNKANKKDNEIRLQRKKSSPLQKSMKIELTKLEVMEATIREQLMKVMVSSLYF